MLYAAIDIGSNSVKLLIAAVDNKMITEQIVFRHTVTGLSKTMFNNLLQPANIELTLNTIIDYIKICNSYHVTSIRIVATQFARIASNSNSLINAIYSHTRIPVEVISGNKEADLTHLAVAQEFADKNILVFNIGGGSTEFIVATPSKLHLRTSLAIGAGQLSREHLTSTSIIPPTEYKQMVTFIKAQLQQQVMPCYNKVYGSLKNTPPSVILSGGTGTNLAQIVAATGIDWSSGNAVFVAADDVFRIEQLLANSSIHARQKIAGIERDRADILPAGVAIVAALLQLTGADKLFVTAKSLAHGIICQMLQDNLSI